MRFVLSNVYENFYFRQMWLDKKCLVRVYWSRQETKSCSYFVFIKPTIIALSFIHQATLLD